MRIAILLAIMGASPLAPAPAEAAVLIRADVSATGATVYPSCQVYSEPVCGTTVAVAQTRFFNLVVEPDGLAVGDSFSFMFGRSFSSGITSGTITRTGLETFAGADNLFAQDQPVGDAAVISTRLTASGFAVAQVFPSPVPEPAAWAMLAMGFAAAGHALRRFKPKPMARSLRAAA